MSGDPFWKALISRIRAEPSLSRDEETRLAARARDGDAAAARKLASSHLGFVIHVARGYRRSGISPAELLQEGTVGLMEAAKRFNPEKGVRFATYARWWVRAAIQDHIVRSRSLVRIGTTARQRAMFFSIRRKAGITGSEALPEEIARDVANRYATSVQEVTGFARRIGRADDSLNTGSANGRDTLLDQLTDERPSPEERLTRLDEARKRLRHLGAALKSLPPREAHIIRRRYLSEGGISRSKLGREMGLSKERVRQLEQRALQSLRRIIQAGIDARPAKRRPA